jgi:hypothetical protein
MGLREIVWGSVLLLLLYAGWQFGRALLLARKLPSRLAVAAQPALSGGQANSPASFAGGTGGEAAAAGRADTARPGLDDDEDDGFDYAPELRPDRERPSARPQPASGGDIFQLELDNQRLRRDMVSFQRALEQQHDEIQRLQNENQTLRAELDSLSANASASPEYSEALVLARQGLSAEMIAGRCGITQSEAELVLSMVRGQGGRL